MVASTKQNSHNKTRLFGVKDGKVPGEGEAPSCTPRRKFMSSQILEAGQGWSQETLSSEVALEAEVYGARSRQADNSNPAADPGSEQITVLTAHGQDPGTVSFAHEILSKAGVFAFIRSTDVPDNQGAI